MYLKEHEINIKEANILLDHILMHNYTLETEYIICDLDNTLFDARPRAKQFLTLPNKPNWEGFNNACWADNVIDDVYKVLIKCDEIGMGLVFLTSRSDYAKEMTEQKINELGFSDYRLFMRKPEHGYISSVSFKMRMINFIIGVHQQGRSPYMILDDEKEIIEIFKREFMGAAFRVGVEK